jgi:hypothetical protein
LPSAGLRTEIVVKVQHAATCQLTLYSGLGQKVSFSRDRFRCSSGRYAIPLIVGANGLLTVGRLTFRLVVRRGTYSALRGFTVVTAPHTPSSQSASSPNSTTSTTVTSPTTTATATALLPETSPPPRPDSTLNCIDPSGMGVEGETIQPALASVTAQTGVTYNCIELYANADPTWSDWTYPYVLNDGYVAWSEAESARQIILTINLVPNAVIPTTPWESNFDPYDEWEEPCAEGDYNTYATQLAQNRLYATNWGERLRIVVAG